MMDAFGWFLYRLLGRVVVVVVVPPIKVWNYTLFKLRKAGYWSTCTARLPDGRHCGHSMLHLDPHVFLSEGPQ